MLIRLNPRSSAPLFEQIADSVRRAVADGSAPAGTKLPVARELAASLDVNVHTVLHGYQVLRDEGVIELRRGRGAVVVAAESDLHAVRAAVRTLIQQARRHGLDLDQTVAMIREEMS